MTTPLTPVAARTTVEVPVGTDPVSLAVLVAAYQALLNRSEWNAKSLIVPSIKVPDMGGNDYPDGTSYALVTGGGIDADFDITTAIGDLVLLVATGTLIFTAAVNSSYQLQWWDGAAELVDVDYNKGAAWTANESLPIGLTGYSIAASAGAKTYSLRGKRTGSTATVQGGTLRVFCLHIKLGAA
jgi:hypothetical protein